MDDMDAHTVGMAPLRMDMDQEGHVAMDMK